MPNNKINNNNSNNNNSNNYKNAINGTNNSNNATTDEIIKINTFIAIIEDLIKEDLNDVSKIFNENKRKSIINLENIPDELKDKVLNNINLFNELVKDIKDIKESTKKSNKMKKYLNILRKKK